MRRIGIWNGLVIALLLATSDGVSAQQAVVTTPVRGVQDGFYEHFNTSWGFRRQSPRGAMFFNFNSPAIPPFGGYDPNADARFGIAQRWGNANMFFRFTAGAGRTSTMTMTAPSVTSMNGVPGSIRDVSVRPFVVGLVPTVGDYPIYPVMPLYSAPPTMLISPLAGKLERLQYERAQGRTASDSSSELEGDPQEAFSSGTSSSKRVSSAERGDVSLAEIRRQQKAEEAAKQRELEELIAEAKEAELAGQFAIARVRYRQAASKAGAEQRRELLEQAARLSM